MSKAKTIAERVAANTDRRGPEECWPWKLKPASFGYGRLQVDGRSRTAHSVVYELAAGAVPPGMVIRHLCHNPICVNPGHLTTGTQRENIGDSVAADRHCRGSRNGMALLTEGCVRVIRARLAAGHRGTAIASDFGVGKHVVSSIARGRTWRHA